ILDNGHSETEYADQIIDACDFLIDEAESTGAGRLLALNIHPWMLGQPHRIRMLERVLAHITSTVKVWSASPSEIVAVWKDAQQA
ncbi:MAG: polysaccharide deacetylase, partial [Pseudomonadota bacterium]